MRQNNRSLISTKKNPEHINKAGSAHTDRKEKATAELLIATIWQGKEMSPVGRRCPHMIPEALASSTMPACPLSWTL